MIIPFWLLALPFLIQGALMFFDEFYYHWKRGLPKWERIGHPVDTASVLSVFAWILLAAPNESHLWVLLALSTASCFLVTKDEFVHSQECEPGENYLHSLLFILHPMVFVAAGVMWWNLESQPIYRFMLTAQTVVILLFFFYQIGYWNLWKKSQT